MSSFQENVDYFCKVLEQDNHAEYLMFSKNNYRVLIQKIEPSHVCQNCRHLEENIVVSCNCKCHLKYKTKEANSQ